MFLSYSFLLVLSLLSTSKCKEDLCFKEDDLVVFVSTPESQKQKLSKQKNQIIQKQFFYFLKLLFVIYCWKRNNSKLEANTNADQLKEMQLREKTSLQEQVNELQGQLDELKGENFCYKTRIEKPETEKKKFARPNSCSRAIQ